MNFNEYFNNYKEFFTTKLKEKLSSLEKDAPSLIREAMDYAVSNGGKRIRPVILLATGELIFGLKKEDLINYALAIEFIHSYSLVHDDLPAMDNDDYRRGKLSTHKKFGESYGILCGDALLNLAMNTCLDKKNFSPFDAEATNLLFNYSGYQGMIAGQVLDLLSENKEKLTEKELYDIYINKTSKLLTSPLLIPSILSNKKYFNELKTFGEILGILFQIVDDIIDIEGTLESIGKTPHKDEEENKFTSIKLYGFAGAKEKAKELYDIAINNIKDIPNNDFLLGLLDLVYKRKN